MFNRILVPIDGSEKGYESLDLACEFANKFTECEIYILSIFYHHSFKEGALSMTGQTPVKNEDLTPTLSDFAKEVVQKSERQALQSGVDKKRVKGFIQEGHSAQTILKFEKEHGIDLIITLRHKQKGFMEYLFGGTSLEVTKKATCPVLVI